LGATLTRGVVSSGALPGTSSSSLFGFHRPPACASGAPLLARCVRSSRPHLSRALDLDC
jgi:hypothetical protein